jgi:hypothetical protein
MPVLPLDGVMVRFTPAMRCAWLTLRNIQPLLQNNLGVNLGIAWRFPEVVLLDRCDT